LRQDLGALRTCIITGMELSEIQERLQSHRDELTQRGVASLAVFGSVARGESRAASDVDILVEFDAPVDLFDFVEIQSALQDILGVSHVDLISKNALKGPMREKVLREAVPVA